MPVEILYEFKRRFGVQILEGYGLSETSPVATFSRREHPIRAGSIGTPVWGVERRLVDDDWNPIEEVGAVGEIAVRGHNVMKGYFNRPEETAAVMREGWFRTGDLARRDADGAYYIVDRRKDMIIRGGFNVYPREVEELLLSHPAVSLAAVVGVPSAEHGEEIKAFVIRKPGAEIGEGELVEWARERIAAYKYPRLVEFRDSLPMTASGKILKRELRKPAARMCGMRALAPGAPRREHHLDRRRRAPQPVRLPPARADSRARQGFIRLDIERREYIDLAAGIAVNARSWRPDILAALRPGGAPVAHQQCLPQRPPSWRPNWSRPADSPSACSLQFRRGGQRAAIKLVRKYAADAEGARTSVIVTFGGSFHGRAGHGHATAQPKPARLRTVAGRFPPRPLNDVDALDTLLDDDVTRRAGRRTDPGRGWRRSATPEFCAAARALRGWVLARVRRDQCGMGRTGRLWAHE